MPLVIKPEGIHVDTVANGIGSDAFALQDQIIDKGVLVVNVCSHRYRAGRCRMQKGNFMKLPRTANATKFWRLQQMEQT